MVRTTQAKFLSWRDLGKVKRVGRHFSHFKKHFYLPCSKEGKPREGEKGGCRIKPETRDLQFLWGSACVNIIVFFKLAGVAWIAITKFLCC